MLMAFVGVTGHPLTSSTGAVETLSFSRTLALEYTALIRLQQVSSVNDYARIEEGIRVG